MKINFKIVSASRRYRAGQLLRITEYRILTSNTDAIDENRRGETSPASVHRTTNEKVELTMRITNRSPLLGYIAERTDLPEACGLSQRVRAFESAS